MRVLRSRTTELERDFAFGIVRQLFEPALMEASDSERADLLDGAAGIGAGLLGLAGSPAPAGAADSDFDPSFAIMHGLYWLCANLAAAGPLVVVVDDAHWAEAPSLRYLAFLVTRLEELSATLVVATRPSDAGTDAELLATLVASPSADAIRLGPLTRAGVAEVVTTALGEPAEQAFVDACARHRRDAVPAPRARRGATQRACPADRGGRRRGGADRRAVDRPDAGAPPATPAGERPPAGGGARRPRAERPPARYLRRALEEPSPGDRQAELLLELGLAEASAGIGGWDEHLREAVAAAPNATAGARAARSFGRALNRSQRFAEAVEVLDRAASALRPEDAELALRLEAAAVRSWG
jgi:hypothetical protein